MRITIALVLTMAVALTMFGCGGSGVMPKSMELTIVENASEGMVQEYHSWAVVKFTDDKYAQYIPSGFIGLEGFASLPGGGGPGGPGGQGNSPMAKMPDQKISLSDCKTVAEHGEGWYKGSEAHVFQNELYILVKHGMRPPGASERMSVTVTYKNSVNAGPEGTLTKTATR